MNFHFTLQIRGILKFPYFKLFLDFATNKIIIVESCPYFIVASSQSPFWTGLVSRPELKANQMQKKCTKKTTSEVTCDLLGNKVVKKVLFEFNAVDLFTSCVLQ